MKLCTPLFGVDLSQMDSFVAAGVLSEAEIYVAEAVAHASGDTRFELLLATSLAVRAVRYGQVSILLNEAQLLAEIDPFIDVVPGEVTWPVLDSWLAVLGDSPAVRIAGDESGSHSTALVLDGNRLYLDRYWNYEDSLGELLLRRIGWKGGLIGDEEEELFEEILDKYFPLSGQTKDELQRTAIHMALTSRFSVIAGGPGTGKTRTIARTIAVATEISQMLEKTLNIVLVAPTGKAATRVTDALRREGRDLSDAAVTRALLSLRAQTVHRLLGSNAKGTFRYNAMSTLPCDLVIVDEASMVSLSLMTALVEALRPECSLVLVGDPFQLASVEAGAVLEEIVGPSLIGDSTSLVAKKIVLLRHVHRFDERSAIAQLADAVRSGDGDRVISLLSAPEGAGVVWIRPDEQARLEQLRQVMVGQAQEVCAIAHGGEVARALALLDDWKVLCATRYGAFGAMQWTTDIERGVDHAQQCMMIGANSYVGRPVIVVRNDYLNGLMNGDTGLVIVKNDGIKIAFQGEEDIRLFSLAQVADVETWWSMTIHKSQGSEFNNVVVSLPGSSSAVLSRELVYTAITRAIKSVTIVSSEAVLRDAISRELGRGSGLRQRLWGP
jgi:exodeoxyribonuclease V alpha subunit